MIFFCNYVWRVRLLKLPPFAGGAQTTLKRTMVLEGFSFMYSILLESVYSEILVLTDIGVAEFWSKIFSLPQIIYNN